MNEETESQSKTLRKPNKNCKRCWGRGVVTLILYNDETGNLAVARTKDARATVPCSCTFPKTRRN